MVPQRCPEESEDPMTTLRKLTLGTIAALMLASSPAMARPGYHHCYSDAQDAQAHHSSGDNGDELCPDTETSAQKKQEVTFNYSCNLESGKSHLLVNETKNFLLWRGKKYAITFQPECGKYGWHAVGNGTAFDVCAMTKGVASIDQPGQDDILCDQYPSERR